MTATASMKVPEPAILSNFFLTPALQNRYIDLGQSITLVDALRATTAAPTYFPPIQIGRYHYHLVVPGRFVLTNLRRSYFKRRGIDCKQSFVSRPGHRPIHVERSRSRSVCVNRNRCGFTSDIYITLMTILTYAVGATENHDSSFKRDANSPASQVVRQALSLATNSEKIHQEVFHHLCEFHETYKIAFPTHYLWLNCSIPADLSSLSVTDPKQLNKLKDLAKESLLSDEMQKKMSVFGSY